MGQTDIFFFGRKIVRKICLCFWLKRIENGEKYIVLPKEVAKKKIDPGATLNKYP